MGAEEQQEEGWAEELWEVEEEVRVARVQAVEGEIGGGEVVAQVVEGGDDGVGEEGGPGDGVGGVEFGVDGDGEEEGPEAGDDHEEEGEGSVGVG